jgi:hypothetical protein
MMCTLLPCVVALGMLRKKSQLVLYFKPFCCKFRITMHNCLLMKQEVAPLQSAVSEEVSVYDISDKCQGLYLQG